MGRDRFIDEPGYGPVENVYIYKLRVHYTVITRPREKKKEEVLCFLILSEFLIQNTTNIHVTFVFVSTGF